MATAIRYRRLTMMKRLSMSVQAVFGAWAGGSLITFGLITVGLVLPILAGLAGAIMPATGVFPALGGDSISLQPAQDFLATPGLGRSVWLTISIGVGTTCLALAGTFSILAAASTGRPLKWLRRVIGPMIAVPPSAVAIGILFLLAPSGWMMRLMSPWLTGLERPAAFALTLDPGGAALIFALLAKEIPFLLLVSLAAMATLPAGRILATGASLGYGRGASWLFLLMPLIYRRIRLPLAAVMIFALSVVDMTRILGPSLPPPLAVLAVEAFEDADLARRFPAAFGACLQIVVTIVALAIWRGGEAVAGLLLTAVRRKGARLRLLSALLTGLAVLAALPVLAGFAGLLAAAIWSLAGRWFFPAPLPTELTLRYWDRALEMLPIMANSVILAVIAAGLAVILTLLVVARGDRLRPVIYAPLLVPQVSFVLGLQMVLTMLWLDGSWLAMIWIHMLFILPFTWLILFPAFAGIDRRHLAVAASLGAGPWQRYWRITLPLLAPAITTALFVGGSVSVALYLPSLFAGAGRINTITVEAVALASGGSRQMAGVAAMLQLLVPLLMFLLLQSLYRWRYGRFAGMRGGGLH
ncbi:MAG: ABC transporter permease [Candidatus Puniceispirillaceae bacterium]